MELWGPYKWPYKWLTVLITLVIGVINPVITGSGGPPCRHPVIYLLRMSFWICFWAQKICSKKGIWMSRERMWNITFPPWKLNKYPLKNCLLEDEITWKRNVPFFQGRLEHLHLSYYWIFEARRFPGHPIQTREKISWQPLGPLLKVILFVGYR